MHAVPEMKARVSPASCRTRDPFEREVAISSRGCTRRARFQPVRGAAIRLSQPAPCQGAPLWRSARLLVRHGPDAPGRELGLRPGPSPPSGAQLLAKVLLHGFVLE